MQRTTIMLPAELRDRISLRASTMHVSLGEFLRIAAEAYLDRQERMWTEDPLPGGACVVREPAPADVSANLDRYLYGGKT
jgi:hypothetical protein